LHYICFSDQDYVSFKKHRESYFVLTASAITCGEGITLSSWLERGYTGETHGYMCTGVFVCLHVQAGKPIQVEGHVVQFSGRDK